MTDTAATHSVKMPILDYNKKNGGIRGPADHKGTNGPILLDFSTAIYIDLLASIDHSDFHARLVKYSSHLIYSESKPLPVQECPNQELRILRISLHQASPTLLLPRKLLQAQR